MNKSFVVLFGLLLLSGSCVANVHPAINEPRTIVVPDDYASIQDAVDNALEGDTVYVKKGVYIENPVINKSISLVGEDRAETVIDVTAGLKVQRDGVAITGLTIYDGYDGISLAANYCNISGNKITNTTHGIVVFGYENSISGNIFESIGLSSAIQLNFADRNLINENYIVSCVEGIQIWQHSSNNTITENTITNCQDTAINFQYSNANVMVGNNISRSGLGTSIYGSSNNIIFNNNYISNAIQFSANEEYYLSFGYNRSVNTINQNYWSDYSGNDDNGDGVGDTSYVIDEHNRDNNPLMKPIAVSQTHFLSPTPAGTTELPATSPSPESRQEPFPTVTVVAVSVAAAVVVAGLLIYYNEKRKQNT